MTEIIDLQPSHLTELEAVIEGGMRTFVEVGTALAEIRDGRLYKASGFTDFDVYCRERWGFSRRRAGQMIEAATIAEELGTMVPSQTTAVPAPSNERQVRALAEVAPEHRAETWAAVVKERGADVTARDVREVAQVLETVRAEPDGPALIEEVKSGNWGVSDVKTELKHRGVDWKPAAPVSIGKARDDAEKQEMRKWVQSVPKENLEKWVGFVNEGQVPLLIVEALAGASGFMLDAKRELNKITPEQVQEHRDVAKVREFLTSLADTIGQVSGRLHLMEDYGDSSSQLPQIRRVR